MPTSFDTLTRQQANAYIEPLKTEGKTLDVETNKRLYEGDHWLDGEGWTGPRPQQGHTEYTATMALIARAFTSQNAVLEVVQRHAAGVIGHEPDWGLTVRRSLADGEEPNEEEQQLIAEAHAALTSWWDRVKAHKELAELVATALWAKRATLRIFVPPDEIDAETGELVRAPADLNAALELIWPMRPNVGQATVTRDRRSMREVSVYVYEDEAAKQTRAEVSYVDQATGETVLRILGEPSDENPAGVLQETRLRLDRNLFAHELTLAPLVTSQVRSNQKQLNLACTMAGRNVEIAGFLERIILNGQMPGHYEADSSAPDGQRFVPDPFQVGAGTTNFIAGVTYTDEQGNTKVASPSVVYRDPAPVDTFTATEDAAYARILKETRQLHAKISGDATASGESRRQARTDFENSLEPTAREVNAAGRWLIETVLALASAFLGQSERYAALRANFECRVDAGPLSAEEQNSIMAQNEKELLSSETAMSLLGREDPDAELQRIRTEKEANLQLMGPVQQVQLERQQLSLERDRQAAQGQSETERIRQQILAGSGGAQ